MFMAILGFIAVVLTCTMFAARNSMLGFPSAIFWALTGAWSYTQSTATWDIYFIMAFACFLGMVAFSALGAYALREKRDTIADVEFEKEEGKLIDDKPKAEEDELDKAFGKDEPHRPRERKPQGRKRIRV